MKEIKAFLCDFCTKILKTKSGIKTHELKCFKNPERKACITCESLKTAGFLGERRLTPNEIILFNNEDSNAYKISSFGDTDMKILKKEYEYLYNSELKTYCEKLKIILKNLRYNCESYNLKRGLNE